MDTVNTQGATETRHWWQWFLIYPAFAIALIGAVPTYFELYQSHQKDVAFGDSKRAVLRNELWKKNLECSSAPMDPLITESNIKVDATICRSGDVLIRVVAPGDEKLFEWVSIENLFPKRIASFSLISRAYAQSDTPMNEMSSPVVLCQRWLNNSLLLRRVSYGVNNCVDETINTYSGQVVSTRPAPCHCN